MVQKVDPYADATTVGTPPAEKLREISGLAQTLVNREIHIATMEEQLRKVKEEARVLREEMLPEAMAAVKLKDFTLTTGERIVVEPFFHCSLSGATKIRALNWLRATGRDGLIKRVVSVAFSKGKDGIANDLVQRLEGLGFTAENKEDVNTTSFKALIKELVEEGKQVPLQDLGVYAGTHAVIIHPTHEGATNHG